MKRIFRTALFAAGLFIASTTLAQAQHDTSLTKKVGIGAKKGWRATKKTAVKVGDKTAELSSKGASAVVDKKYDGMVTASGHTVYIDENSRYYYVNKTGHHIYVKKSSLKHKMDD